ELACSTPTLAFKPFEGFTGAYTAITVIGIDWHLMRTATILELTDLQMEPEFLQARDAFGPKHTAAP
ncbi:unnamed protein product, partial [Rotaria magnacalcarata]